jgi:hypothetical protein
MAKEATIMAGHLTAPLKFLVSLLDTILLTRSLRWAQPFRTFVSDAYCSYTVFMALRGPDQDYSGDLWTLIQRFSSSSATNPRDKIYSLLGIARPYPNCELCPDYILSWQDVYRNATRYVIQGSQNLDIIASAASARGLSELPSWVPDFADQSVYDLPRAQSIEIPMAVPFPGTYQAGGLQMARTKFSHDGRFLMTEAILVGRVQHVLAKRGGHFGPGSGPVQELVLRFTYIVAQYRDAQPHVSGAYVVKLGSFLAKMLYYTIFGISPHADLPDDTWPLMDFVNLCLKSVLGPVSASEIPAPRLKSLETRLLATGSSFVASLEPEFSLVEDFQASFTRGGLQAAFTGDGLSDEDLATVARIPFFQVLGLCRRRRGWLFQDQGERDYTVVVPGCSVPLLLRPVDGSGTMGGAMRIVSDAYVYGVMDGEALGKNLPRRKVLIM